MMPVSYIPMVYVPEDRRPWTEASLFLDINHSDIYYLKKADLHNNVN